jgi:two-component system chemotaxis response regulator CheB
MAKALIVDDSALMRRHLREILSAAGHQVLAVRNGIEALEALNSFQPDVITLDINMPEMDGLTCLSRIMTQRPTPVLMVSSLTERGAEVTFEAMALGAVDYIQKPEGTISLSLERIEQETLEKVKVALRARLRRGGPIATPAPVAEPAREIPFGAGTGSSNFGIVMIGVSTGGPGTLEQLLPALPSNFPWAVLVAQHMPSSFTNVFAGRLNDLCKMPVVEAGQMMSLEPGVVYVARGDADAVIGKRGSGWVVNPLPSDSNYLWHPSVARMVESALRHVPIESTIGVMLTGMGDDGADAMVELKRRGGRTIAQDQGSSVIWGMPGELVRRGGASLVLPANQIAGQLSLWLRASSMKREARYGPG